MLRRRLFVLVVFALWIASCDAPGGGTGGGDGSAPPDGTTDAADGTTGDTSPADTKVDGTSGTDATSWPDTTGDTSIGPAPDWGDDEALLAWLVAVVRTCPPMSYSTAPGLWKMTMITDYGCIVRHPEEWIVHLQPGIFEVTADATRHVGYSVVGTYLEGTDWDEVSLGDYLIAELQKGYPDLRVLGADTETDPYGFGTRFRVIIMKFTMDGTRELGVAKVLHAGCSWVLNNCALTASISWAPVEELPIWACTLGQIEATLRCPSGGEAPECDEGDCDTSCKGQGNTGGTCIGDNCMCF